MPTTADTIRKWLDSGKADNATHMIVATDVFDWEDYPVYVYSPKRPLDIASRHEKVMEIYALHLDLESQLREFRAWHPEGAPTTNA